MFTLMVSFNAGASYEKFMEAENFETVKKRAEQEDLTWLRWYIEKDGKPIKEIICPIHKGFLSILVALKNKEKQ